MISVIIPVYNEESNIGRLLTELSRVAGLEIIVSDGGSTDATAEICGRFPIVYINGPAGRGGQLNAGARQATGEVLFFVHGDSLPQPRVFQDIQKAVEKGRQWGCCRVSFDGKGFFYKLLAWMSNIRAIVFSSCYGDQGIYCHRELFYRVGMFPLLPFMEDLALSGKLKKHERAWVIPGRIVTSSRRFQAGGPLKTWLKMQLLKILFALGVSPGKMHKLYQDKRRHYGFGNSHYE